MPANRSRRRANQRGAIYVESLIVAALLAICFACGVFLASLFEHKLADRRDTTANTWLGAEQGCGEPAGGKLNDPGSLETVTPPPIGAEWPDATFLGSFQDYWVQISDTVNKPSQMGGGSVSFTTKDQVLCADPEVPNAGDPKNPLGAVTWAVGDVRGQTGF